MPSDVFSSVYLASRQRPGYCFNSRIKSLPLETFTAAKSFFTFLDLVGFCLQQLILKCAFLLQNEDHFFLKNLNGTLDATADWKGKAFACTTFIGCQCLKSIFFYFFACSCLCDVRHVLLFLSVAYFCGDFRCFPQSLRSLRHVRQYRL